MKKIIAIVGMCGAGKSVACEYFEKLGFKIIYFGGVTMDKLKEAGLEINPENEKMMREKLRSEHGMGAFAKLLLPRIEAEAQSNNVVLDGLYSWDELNIIKEKFDVVTIAIIVDKNIRYSRLKIREIRPLKEIEAKRRDIAEIENISKAGPIAYAEYYINNNGTKEELRNRINEILNCLE